MLKRTGTLYLIVNILFYACGCVSANAVSIDEYQKEPRSGIVRMVLTDGSIIEFDSFFHETGSYANGEVVGMVKNGDKVHIPVGKIKSVSYNVNQRDGTNLFICAAVAGAVALVILASSWDFFQTHD